MGNLANSIDKQIEKLHCRVLCDVHEFTMEKSKEHIWKIRTKGNTALLKDRGMDYWHNYDYDRMAFN